MSRVPTDHLIAALAQDVTPVKPLAPPLKRALATIAGMAAVGGLAVYFIADLSRLLGRYAGREHMMMLEMLAMLMTGVLAVTGAFFVSVPGRSRKWLLAPLPSFAAWIFMSGIGCYAEMIRSGPAGWEIGHSVQCLIFIVAISLLLGVPLVWRLSRARPLDSLPVAVLGGLGVAAFSAFLLQFFHLSAATFIDLGVHVVAITLVVLATGLLNRRALSPA
jgi:hypothetical protein